MQVKSIQKYVHISPRKLREVVALTKGLKPMESLEKLPFAKKSAASALVKAIQTAVANAKQKGLQESDLVFKEIQINEGPRLKRFRAGARGRAKPYIRQLSHIRIVLDTVSSDLKVNSKKANAKTAAEDVSVVKKGEGKKSLASKPIKK